MKYTFYSNNQKYILKESNLFTAFNTVSIDNQKLNIVLTIKRKYILDEIGTLLLKNIISLKRFLRLKNSMNKDKIIKFRKDKNKNVLIEKSLNLI